MLKAASGFVFALVASIPLLSSIAMAQEACPQTPGAIEVGKSLTCRCTPELLAFGAVYGTARYSHDSSLCRAARHAGAIQDGGGVVTVYGVESCSKFVGSNSNGINTNSWNSAVPRTYAFVSPAPACGLASVADAPKPAAGPASPAAPAAAPAPAPAAAPAAALPKDCPYTMDSAGIAPGQSLTCGCTPTAVKGGGSVYGTDRYSGDSSTCVAARHAGKVSDAGGAVTVYVADGCAKYDGTERNGVTSRSWSSATSRTIAFASPVPPCPTAPAAAPKPVAAPAGPPPGSPMAGWMKRAQDYGTALPEPLPGWTALPIKADASDSAMNGRYVSAFRQYRLGKHPAYLDSVSISIGNNPDGSARYPIEFWNNPAKAAAEGYKKVKVAGRDALEFTAKSGDTTDLFFLMSNNLFVTISWQEAHLPRARMEEYLKVLDFAKIEALASK